MSQGYYQEVWKQTQDELKKTLAQDGKLRRKGPIPDEKTAKRLLGHLFLGYLQNFNRLEYCYDHIIHPQKREVIGRLLDLSLGRLLELKAEVRRIELENFWFLDDALLELKMTYKDLQIKVPKYFLKDREKDKMHRRELMDKVFQEMERENFKKKYLENFPEKEQESAWEKYLENEEKMRLEKEKFEEQQRKIMKETKEEINSASEEMGKDSKLYKEEIKEAISLIQRHERARQGRTQAVLAKRYLFIKHLGDAGKIPKKEAIWAAKVIQQHWRRYRKRVKEAKIKAQLYEILGLVMPQNRDMTNYKIIEEHEKRIRKLQNRNQAEYESAAVKIKNKVTALYSISFEEDTVDEIMSWFRWYFDQSGFLPDFPPLKPVLPPEQIMGVPKKLGPQFYDRLYPQPDPKKRSKTIKPKTPPPNPADDLPTNSLATALSGIKAIGGSALVVAGHWIGPKEFAIVQKELEKRKQKNDEKGEKKPTKEEKEAAKRKEKEAERKRLLAEAGKGFQMQRSNFAAPLVKADYDYRTTWIDLDERKNYKQRYIPELVKNEKCYELGLEIRNAVDRMMMLELEILKDALQRDLNPKKKKKKKKGKTKKQKKKKQKKDLTGDLTNDDIFYELFKNGIIKDYEEVTLRDFIGEKCFAAFELRERLIDCPPSLGDILAVMLNVILPLGSSRIHQLSPLVRSVCIMGAENAGKEFLARLVCTETAAIMFDLTPENVAGKYPGKEGLKRLHHLIEKLSRAIQPSVIFVDGAERTFYKKIPKEEKDLEPRRLANMIQKLIKKIKPEDQILLIGVSSRPWLARKRPFLKTYQNIIFVPHIEYGSYFRLWFDLLQKYKTIPKYFDVSCLAKVSSGYSAKSIMEAISKVMTIQRISTSKIRPLRQIEFLEELLKTKAEDEKMTKKCVMFFEKTELPKKRAQKLAALREEAEKQKRKRK